jgi:hypothetical protein
MDKPISVGDLVQVVKWSPCGCGLGVIGTVHGFTTNMSDRGCGLCGAREPGAQRTLAVELAPNSKKGVPVAWVRRIPPLSELEGERTQEDIREPA